MPKCYQCPSEATHYMAGGYMSIQGVGTFTHSLMCDKCYVKYESRELTAIHLQSDKYAWVSTKWMGEGKTPIPIEKRRVSFVTRTLHKIFLVGGIDEQDTVPITSL